ncbi:phosphoadenosine phosphosulfate reductase family protein [Streptomyces antarcticus]|uniref:phosphoadenosine phosphosulfate reductase family protein n=1 Tax=Streptomyces antarcticus TaxID=2996458 RepID=UPI0022722A97|nr:phosphoadenosine phosphosulfate reductase family protein [Streptomyces sp. H34-AA3]MCY0946265.1 phosphoadenosine phosphosulfate reductase family protein [Streptomyces sp. H34-AA3]
MSTRRRLLEAIRRAHQADAAYTAADRARARAAKAAAAAHTRITHDPQLQAGADELAAAHAAYAGLVGREQEARAKVRRTFTAARAANRTLAALYTPHAPGRGTGGQCRSGVAASLLGELAETPRELILAADKIVVSTSAGKDSLVCGQRVVTLAAEAGCLDKVVLVHADLGEESEWPGVRELAQRQAERWGVEFIVVQADRGLLGLVEKRKMWPDAARRLCTSTLKRDKIAPLFKQITDALGLDEQALILSALGIRAAESPARARKLPLAIDMRASTAQRMVLTWHPILELSEADVWQQIADAALEYHPVYDAVIPRLSCVFCVLAGRDVLVRAVRLCWALGLDLPTRYVALEQHIGHKFREKLSVAEIVAEAARVEAEEGPLVWARGDALRRHVGEEAAADYLRRLALALAA